MADRLAFLFAGQGSQFPGMAAQLNRDEPVFAAELHRLDAVVVRQTGRSLLPQLLDRGPTRDFERVGTTHPAIVVVQLALARTLIERGIRPDAVLGLSLGEVAAAATAGAMTAEIAVEHTVAQAAVLADRCPAGGMLAVLSPPPELASLLPSGCEVGLDGRSQAVVTGLEEPLAVLAQTLRAAGTTCHRMPVRVGFHSAAIDAAAAACLRGFPARQAMPLTLPMGSCLLGDVVRELRPGHLWRSVRDEIRFAGALSALTAAGPTVLVDLGPGGSMAALAADAAVSGVLDCFPVLTPLAAGRPRIPELVTRFG